MSWPDTVVSRFARVPTNPRENDFYGPWNKLLNIVFPPDGPFTVAPQSYPVQPSRESLYFLVEFHILMEEVPVFILKIKTPVSFEFASAREEADDQVRKRLRDLVDRCPLPQLHAVSVFGTKLSFYTGQSSTNPVQITPTRIPRDLFLENDVAPKECWNLDILESDGAEKFRAIVEQIKSQRSHLGTIFIQRGLCPDHSQCR
jgi:hypothetical protein